MLIVHHLNNSRSQRVLWLLEELGLKYRIKHYLRDPKTGRAPPSLKNVHPLGKSPVLQHGDKTIAETGAIIEYVIRTFGEGRLVPEYGTDAYDNYIYFLHYGEGSVMFPQLLALYVSFLGDAADPLQPIITRQMKDHFDFIEYHLTGHEYFAGNELTGADIQMIFPLEAAKSHGRLKEYQACIDFVDRMHARPAYLAALSKGGHYDYGPKI
ncbi:MAG TPA: glutathione S-transferase [Gammaproteobacteria bacterium]|nr:glutathione S-transferase [Gammaproteobacteria bacterium]